MRRPCSTVLGTLVCLSTLLVANEAFAGVPPLPPDGSGSTPTEPAEPAADPAADPAASDTATTADPGADPAATDTGASADASASGSVDLGGGATGTTTGAAAAPDPEPEPNTSVEAGPAPDLEASGPVDEGPGMKGRFGLGAARTLSGINGVNARFFVADKFHLGVNFGAGTFTHREQSPDEDCPANPPDDLSCPFEDTRTTAFLGGSLEGIFWVNGRNAGQLPFRADFGVGGRIGFRHLVNATDIADNLDDDLALDFEIPMIVALYLGKNFFLAPEFGVHFVWVPGHRAPDEDGNSDSNPGFGEGASFGDAAGPGFGWSIGNATALVGGATFGFMFGG